MESWLGAVSKCCIACSAVVMDAAGRSVAWTGDPGLPIFMRSAAKPFQRRPTALCAGRSSDNKRERDPSPLLTACSRHSGYSPLAVRL